MIEYVNEYSPFCYNICFANTVKNRIQPNKFEDLLGFIKQFMNQAAFHLATRRVLREVVQNKIFIERRVGKRAINKIKKLLWGQDMFFGDGERMRRVFIIRVASSFFEGWRGPK